MPTTTCAIRNCTNNTYNIRKWKNSICPVHLIACGQSLCDCPPPFRLRCFPADPELRRLWVKAVNRLNVKTGKKWQPGRYDRICSAHFEEGVEWPTLDLDRSIIMPRPRRKLVRHGTEETHTYNIKRARAGAKNLKMSQTDVPSSEMSDHTYHAYPLRALELPWLPVQEKVYMDDHHNNRVMSKLSQLWQEEKLCDAQITNGITTLQAHKVVLTAACPALLSIYKDLPPQSAMMVNLPSDIDRDTIQAFLVYIYDGLLRLTMDTVSQMTRLAKIMKEDTLLRYCEDFETTFVVVKQEPLVAPDLDLPASSKTSAGTSSPTFDQDEDKASIHCYSQPASSLLVPSPPTDLSESLLLGANEEVIPDIFGSKSSSSPHPSPLTNKKTETSSQPPSLPEKMSGSVLSTSLCMPGGSSEVMPMPFQIVRKESMHTNTKTATSLLPPEMSEKTSSADSTVLLVSSKDGSPSVYGLNVSNVSGPSSLPPAHNVLPLTTANQTESIIIKNEQQDENTPRHQYSPASLTIGLGVQVAPTRSGPNQASRVPVPLAQLSTSFIQSLTVPKQSLTTPTTSLTAQPLMALTQSLTAPTLYWTGPAQSSTISVRSLIAPMQFLSAPMQALSVPTQLLRAQTQPVILRVNSLPPCIKAQESAKLQQPGQAKPAPLSAEKFKALRQSTKVKGSVQAKPAPLSVEERAFIESTKVKRSFLVKEVFLSGKEVMVFRESTEVKRSEVKKRPLSGKELKNIRHSSNARFFARPHERKHDYKCKRCSAQLFTKPHAVQHLQNDHQIDTKDITEYIVAEAKSNPKVIACGICDYQPQQRSHLHLHRYVRHKIPLPKGQTIFRCHVCEKECFRQSALHEHMNLHKDHASYICEKCGMGFTSKHQLKSHIYNRHNDEKRFVCKQCGKSFKNRLQIRIHLRSHTGVRPFKCPECPYQGTTKGNLKAHMWRHHEQSIDMAEVPACQDVHVMENSVAPEEDLMEVLPGSREARGHP